LGLGNFANRKYHYEIHVESQTTPSTDRVATEIGADDQKPSQRRTGHRLTIVKMSEALITQIKTAFADVVYPGDEDLTSSTYGEEPEALKRSFQGKTDWRTLDAEFLDSAPEGWGTALSFFSDRAFVFYLPAYLIADVCNELPSVTPEFHLTHGLLPESADETIADIWGGGTIGERAIRRNDQFDAKQATAIVAYLRWKIEQVEADFHYEDTDTIAALDRYWLARTTSAELGQG
jgi:hypothetical protein